MKKINIIITFVVLALTVVSCETNYDDYNADRKTVIGFSIPSKNINNVPQGGERSSTVDLFVSDMVDVDRQFNIISIPALEAPATAPENYSFDATVTIPANTRVGTITVTGIGNSINTPSGEFFALAVEGGGNVVSGGRISIRVRQ